MFGMNRLEVARSVLVAPATEEELRVRLEVFGEELLRCHFDEPELTAMIHRECERGMPVAMDVFRETFLQSFHTLTQFFEIAQKKKLVTKAISGRTIAVNFFGSLMHLSKSDETARKVFGVSISDPSYRHQIVSEIVSLQLGGALNKKARTTIKKSNKGKRIS